LSFLATLAPWRLKLFFMKKTENNGTAAMLAGQSDIRGTWP
jgi:hypothetical protein